MYTILIVDDDETLCRNIALAVRPSGYNILTARNGSEGIAQCAQADLILLDVMMPKLSGFEVCEKVKGDPKTAGVMVLMVTALSDLGDVERAVNVGCDDYLSKPIHRLELLKRVENMLKLRAVTDELERLRRYIDAMEDQ